MNLIIRFFYVIVFVIIAHLGYSQHITEYYAHCNEARYRIWQGDTKAAFKIYDGVFNDSNKYSYHFIDEYYYACLNAKFGNKEKAVKHLYRCFDKQARPTLNIWDYRSDSAIIISDTLFAFINRDEHVRRGFETKIKALLDSNTASYAKRLRDTAYYAWANDMYLFGDEKRSRKNVFERPDLLKLIDTSLKSHDQLQQKVVDIIKRHGYIGIHNAGTEVFGSSIMHLNKERKDEIRPILEKEWEKGHLPPSEWGFFIERRKMDDFDTSGCWGYYVLTYRCKESQWPEIIENRKKIGMSIYLDQGEYNLNQKMNRTKLPWVDTLVN